MDRAFLIEAHSLSPAREHVAVMGVAILRLARRRLRRSESEIDASYRPPRVTMLRLEHPFSTLEAFQGQGKSLWGIQSTTVEYSAPSPRFAR